MKNIKEIAKQISKLNSNEISELSGALLEYNISATIYRFGITPTFENNSQKDSKLILHKTGHSKLALVKEIKDMFGLGLKDAKDIVDSVPCYLSESIEFDIALNIKKRLENIGAELEIR